MKAKKNWIVTIVMLVIFLAIMQVTQVVGKAEKKTETKPRIKYVFKPREILAGLQGVEVIVEHFRSEAEEKYGFSKQQYQTDVELQLRQYGIKVLSHDESLLTPGQPYLYINVNPIIIEEFGIAAIDILVELRETVWFHRNPTIMMSAITWKQESTAVVGLDRLIKVTDVIRGLVDRFINDYLAANPKEVKAKSKSDK